MASDMCAEVLARVLASRPRSGLRCHALYLFHYRGLLIKWVHVMTLGAKEAWRNDMQCHFP